MREILESGIDRLLQDAVDTSLLSAAERGEWPAALWRSLEDGGFALALVDEAHGGAGASWGDACAIARALGRHGAPVPLGETLMAAHLLACAGLDIPPGIFSIAGTGTGVSMAPADTGWQVSGRFAGVPWGRHADAMVCVVPHRQAPHVVLLPRSLAQVAQARNIAGEPRDDLIFERAAPLAAAKLPDGLPAHVLMLHGAMLRAAQIAGALERVLDLCVSHANERTQFGRAIGKFQAIQQQIAVLASQSASVSAAAEFAFVMADAGNPAFAVAAAKTRASDVSGLAASIAHAVHGAIGFSHEHALHFVTRRLWSWRSEFGSQSYWAEHLGRLACAGGADAFWPLVTSNGATASFHDVWETQV